MTLLVPLEPLDSPLQGPSFLRSSEAPDVHVAAVVEAIMEAKRIVVICGAGISVQAGIPDFRSSEGLFKRIKRDNPREVLVSGKDLFDASVLSSEHSISLFCQMIAQLSELSKAAEPTAFHRLLRILDDSGKLLRVYTQNIDSIESKCGLSFGVPEFEDKRRGKSKLRCTAPDGDRQRPTPSVQVPRCIPLHGTLQLLYCQLCNHSCPLEEHVSSLIQGLPPQCPECASLDQTRQLAGKRSRGIGMLRPSVVLYNEAHRDGEDVGEIVRKDLAGLPRGKGRGGADLLLVVGTSLRVPGAKRIVREFAKAVHCGSSLSTTCPDVPTAELSPIKTIYLNLDFPVPAREWDGVFDVWLRGDAQYFAGLLQHEIRQAGAGKHATQHGRRAVVEPDSSSYERTTKFRAGEQRQLPSSKKSPFIIKIKCRPVPRKVESDHGHTVGLGPKLLLRIPARRRTFPDRLQLPIRNSSLPPSPTHSSSSKPLRF